MLELAAYIHEWTTFPIVKESGRISFHHVQQCASLASILRRTVSHTNHKEMFQCLCEFLSVLLILSPLFQLSFYAFEC